MLSRFETYVSSKEQVSFNIMAAGTVCSDFGAQEIRSVTVSIFPSNHEYYRFSSCWTLSAAYGAVDLSLLGMLPALVTF